MVMETEKEVTNQRSTVANEIRDTSVEQSSNEGDFITVEQDQKRSDGLEEELRMLYVYGAGAKAIR
jgi:hypothetical protein